MASNSWNSKVSPLEQQRLERTQRAERRSRETTPLRIQPYAKKANNPTPSTTPTTTNIDNKENGTSGKNNLLPTQKTPPGETTKTSTQESQTWSEQVETAREEETTLEKNGITKAQNPHAEEQQPKKPTHTEDSDEEMANINNPHQENEEEQWLTADRKGKAVRPNNKPRPRTPINCEERFGRERFKVGIDAMVTPETNDNAKVLYITKALNSPRSHHYL